MSEKKTPAQMAEEGYQAIIKGREKQKNMTPEEILMEEIEDDVQERKQVAGASGDARVCEMGC